MPERIWREAVYLYRSSSTWRIALEAIAIGAIILLLTGGGSGGGSSAPASYNQAASGVPPRVGQGGGGSVIQAPMTPQDLQSDQRLKQFQVAAQMLPNSLPAGARCERLDKIVQDVTGYDRQRARPVHQAFLNEATACRTSLAESDKHLEALEQAASAYRNTQVGDGAEMLVRARGDLTPFDEGRSAFGQYKPDIQFADQAQQALDASDLRGAALRTSLDRLAIGRSAETERAFSVAFDAMTAFDRARGAKKIVEALEAADREKALIGESNRRLEGLRNALSAFRNARNQSTEERLQSAQAALTPVDYARGDTAFATIFAEARQTTQALRQERLQTLVEKVRQGASAAVHEETAKVLSEFRHIDSEGLRRIDPLVLAEAETIAKAVAESDQRLRALQQAAEAVEAGGDGSTVSHLLEVSDNIQPFDKERLSAAHKQALRLASAARDGILQSDRRIAAFMNGYKLYSRKGCNQTLLTSMRQARSALTDQDRERGGVELSNALANLEIQLRRTFCLEDRRRFRSVKD